MQITDPLKASLLAAKVARTERNDLERRLLADLQAAVDHVTAVCVASGLASARVEAISHDWLCRSVASTGKDAADSNPIHLKVGAGNTPVRVLVLAWYPAQNATPHHSERFAGWRAGTADWYLKHARNGHETATQAVTAVLSDPHTARSIADVLVALGA